MSLLGGLATHYATSNNPKVVDFRNALGGPSGMWSDGVPESISFPYCCLAEIDSPQTVKTMGQQNGGESTSVSFEFYAPSRPVVENLIVLCRRAFVSTNANTGELFPVENSIVRSCEYQTRSLVLLQDSADFVWMGTIVLVFRQQISIA